jgi:hypothetical protein
MSTGTVENIDIPTWYLEFMKSHENDANVEYNFKNWGLMVVRTDGSTQIIAKHVTWENAQKLSEDIINKNPEVFVEIFESWPFQK